MICLFIILMLYLASAESQSESLVQKDKTIYHANEIMEQIRIGRDVFCNEATIIGDLKLTGLNLSARNASRRIVNSSINIINSDIKGDVDFGNGLFRKPLKFDGTTFSGPTVNFMRSKFDADVSFSGAIFQCPVHFDGASINGNIYFTKTDWLEKASLEDISCNGDASFRDNDFRKGLNFKYAHLNGPVSFEDSRFNGETSFSNSIFEKDVSFLAVRFADLIELKGVKFNGSARFSRSRFIEIADFSDTQFSNDTAFFYANFANSAKFSRAKFCGKTDFRKCGFDGLADFSSASFLDVSRFDEAQFNKVVRFINSSFTKNVSFFEAYFDRDASFEGARLASTLDLTNATFSKLALPWDTINGHIVYNKATQLSLVNNYKNLGWTQDYRNSYYDYRDKERITEPFGYAGIWDTIDWIYWRYGTNKFLPIVYMSIFGLISALIFASIYYCLVRFKWGKVIRKSGKSGCEKCPWAKISGEIKSELSYKEALIFSRRILLLLNKPDDIEIIQAHIDKIIWIERVLFGFLAANFMNYLLNEVQIHLKPP